jgi:hypothetical protein
MISVLKQAVWAKEGKTLSFADPIEAVLCLAKQHRATVIPEERELKIDVGSYTMTFTGPKAEMEHCLDFIEKSQRFPKEIALMLACGIEGSANNFLAACKANLEDIVAAAQLQRGGYCSFREALLS